MPIMPLISRITPVPSVLLLIVVTGFLILAATWSVVLQEREKNWTGERSFLSDG
jgi:hypothetical protein